MSASWSSLAIKGPWPEERTSQVGLDSYKLGVAGIAAEVVLWSGKSLMASFYLRLASAQGRGRETLDERLNDPGTRFIPCKMGDRTELLNLDWISLIRVAGVLPEVEQREEIGALRRPARLTLQSDYVVQGEFLSVLPSERSRVSDLLNASGERFLLFLTPTASMYVNRTAIVRVVP